MAGLRVKILLVISHDEISGEKDNYYCDCKS